ncbi:collagenase-like protein with putative collagen-binding domain [Larkinella arboricola]|uniref:Collagenase-like protein with putative collagen-binding domain n=1 Tax=Larkinella arboricola TaxID=643671 RepID=A0A327WIJ7_LARAB|nr:DUF5060 domain-containing protein [Larkinella arboricola]RAJ90860.1 collagenase-like protein with putative collagen-binding domain [Larkinella arboricola]
MKTRCLLIWLISFYICQFASAQTAFFNASLAAQSGLVISLTDTPYTPAGGKGLTPGSASVNQAPMAARTTSGNLDQESDDRVALTGFTLINAATHTDLYALKEGDEVNLAVTGTQLNIRVNTHATLSKVVFDLNENKNVRTEREAPYTLAGDTDDRHKAWTPSLGRHTLKATPYDASGQAGTPLTVTFTVVSRPVDQVTLTGFTLINAATHTDLYALKEGDEVNLAVTGTQLNVRVNTHATLSKVVFDLNENKNVRTEREAPYTLAGDTDDRHKAWTPSLGRHTLKATPYDASGQAGTPLTVTFTVVSRPADEEQPGENPSSTPVAIEGELKKWHKITLIIKGPATSETAGENPFLNYRLNVTFAKGAKKYVVPGYFAADGNAGQTSATSGNIWKVHFSPDETGEWSYAISLRKGNNIAINDDPNAGSQVKPVDGRSGTFNVAATDKTGTDLRAKGRLRYVGEHYLQFAETGEFFLKGGVDSPENFLAYDDFDNTPNNGGRRKSWSPHVQDWRSGNPTWKDGKGKGIIGAVNYLASQQLNVFSFLTMNINGDDKNVYPYVSSDEYTRFDCSKLDQWEMVFEHATKLGMYLHFKTQERENCNLLDGGRVGIQRKLYYRELIARFAHHLALNWNIGEENIQTTQQRKEMAQYFQEHDPYNHHIVIHTNVKEQDEVYTPLLGNHSAYTGASIQTDWNNVYRETKLWVQESAKSDKKWVVANDEQNSVGVSCDADYQGNRGNVADNQDDMRKEALWGNLMAGGAGVEYYFGGSTGETDLAAEDFRSRAKMYRYTRHALTFFRSYVPLKQVRVMNNVNSGWVLGQEGELYVVYLKDGGSADITINTGAAYTVQWYDPRNGGNLQNGSVRSFLGDGSTSIGYPPNNSREDWVALIRKASDRSNRLTQSGLSRNETNDLQVVLLGNPIKNDAVEVAVHGAGDGPLRLQLVGVRGEVVADKQISKADPLEKQRISVSGQAAGLFLLRVSTPRQSQTLKIMKDE